MATKKVVWQFSAIRTIIEGYSRGLEGVSGKKAVNSDAMTVKN